MSTARTLPNVGLKGFWALGEDGWDVENNQNLLALSVLTQGRALNLVAATPSSPSNGDVYLFTSAHPTQPNKIAVRDNGAWTYIAPLAGWTMYDVAAGAVRRYNGTSWVFANTEGFQIALSDFTTALSTGTSKAGWIAPYDCVIKEVFIGLTMAQSTSGSVTVDAKVGGTSIFSTLPSIDANEDTSLTGTTAVVSSASLSKGQKVLFDITAAGTGAKGLIITLTVAKA